MVNYILTSQYEIDAYFALMECLEIRSKRIKSTQQYPYHSIN